MATESERWNLFMEGVQLVFKGWSALQLAVENDWGGRGSAQKEEELEEDILYWFTLCKTDPDVFALEDQLTAAMLEDFHTEVEDGSVTEVAESLVTLYHECGRGDQTLLEKLRSNVSTLSEKKTNATDPMECESSSDSEEDSGAEGDVLRELTPKRPPETDSDGFTVVCNRRRR